jgi:hypothetical protein
VETTELVSSNRESILKLAEAIFTARRLSDSALREALIDAGFEPLSTDDDPSWR